MYDLDQARRKAMALLEAEVGGPSAAAARAGMSYAQWANLRSGAPDSKTGKARGMRKETARKIEEAFGKPEGWLDIADLIELDPNADSGLDQVLEAWRHADETSKAVPRAWASAVLASVKRK